MTDKLEEYRQLQKEWRDISTAQLSIANNILITISSGYLALIFDKNEIRKIKINTSNDFDWSLIFYCGSIFLTLIAILLGLLVLLNRLYDFRISRHIALTRKRFLEKHKEPIEPSSIGEISFFDILVEQKNLFFKNIDFIPVEEIEKFKENKNQFTKRFNRLRRQAKVFGITSHKWTKFQVVSLLISLTLYIIYILNSREVIPAAHMP